MTFAIASSALAAGGQIPRKFTGEGEDVSPPLSWTAVPEGTQELALICDDPDAPTAVPWVHWVIYKIPASATGLPQNVAKTAQTIGDIGALQGTNSWNRIGYGGPMPPPGHGVHHYYFKLYALDTQLQLDAGVDKEALLKAMAGHILAKGELIGTYQR